MFTKANPAGDAKLAAAGGAREIARQAENYATGRAIRTDKPEPKNDGKQKRKQSDT